MSNISASEKREACEAIAAILNKHGRGDVYFGVFDNGDIKGQVITDSTIKDVSEMISTNIEPRIVPTIENLVIDNKNVLKISFYYNSIYY